MFTFRKSKSPHLPTKNANFENLYSLTKFSSLLSIVFPINTSTPCHRTHHPDPQPTEPHAASLPTAAPEFSRNESFLLPSTPLRNRNLFREICHHLLLRPSGHDVISPNEFGDNWRTFKNISIMQPMLGKKRGKITVSLNSCEQAFKK